MDKNVVLGKVRSARRLLTIFEMLGLLSVAVTIIVVLLYWNAPLHEALTALVSITLTLFIVVIVLVTGIFMATRPLKELEEEVGRIPA